MAWAETGLSSPSSDVGGTSPSVMPLPLSHFVQIQLSSSCVLDRADHDQNASIYQRSSQSTFADKAQINSI